mgnify:CR=1 FL=1
MARFWGNVRSFSSGAVFNDGNGSNSGHVRIYDYNTSTEAWAQVGADIDGEAADESDLLESFIREYYLSNQSIPPSILMSHDMNPQDRSMLEEYLSKTSDRKVKLRHPQRGPSVTVLEMARKNAELLLKEVIAESAELRNTAQRFLLDIYQDECEWQQAIRLGEALLGSRFFKSTDNKRLPMMKISLTFMTTKL